MFDKDVVELNAAGTLAATVREQAAENEAARRRLLLAVHFADLHPSPAMIPGGQTVPGGERGLLYGGPGCPGVAEFAVAEFGAVLGVSTESAAKHIGQALALRHRLPLIWEAVKASEATPWKARQVATACQELSLEAAAIVDRTVAPVIDTVGPIQLRNIIKAAIWEADPEAARAAAEQKARERGVWTGRSDEHGTTAVYLKAATGDVIHFDATLNQIADALTTLNGPAPKQLQRAKALGILADPALAHQLLQVAHHLASTQPSTTPSGESTPSAPATPPRLAPAEPVSSLTNSPTPAAPKDPATQLQVVCERAAATTTEPAAAGGTMPPATTPPGAPIRSTPPVDPRRSTNPHAAPPTAGPTMPPAITPPVDSNCSTTSHAEPPRAAGSCSSGGPAPIRSPHANTNSEDLAPAQVAPAGKAPADPASPAPLYEPTHAEDVTIHGEPAHDLFLQDEPSADTEADRDPPHPSSPNHPLNPPQPERPNTRATAELAAGLDSATRQDLAAKLSAIKAFTDRADQAASGTRPARTKLYVHLTDETLLAGGGTMRIEGFGPVFANLAELLGHDRITIQPVIDLHDQINVNAYEIPRRLREHLKLAYPVEQFPYGPGETTHRTDLDHVVPYTPIGSPNQTSTTNLRPLRRRSHRIKTFAGWKTRALDNNASEWTTLHGYKFRVDPTGTHPIPTEEFPRSWSRP